MVIIKISNDFINLLGKKLIQKFYLSKNTLTDKS